MLTTNKQNLLHVAARAGNTAAVEMLIARLDVNASDRWHRIPLHWAILNHHPAVVAFLLQAGADPNFRIREGAHKKRTNLKQQPPLHLAARTCHSSAAVLQVRHLLAAGADASLRDGDGQTPLHHAALFVPSTERSDGDGGGGDDDDGDQYQHVRSIIAALVGADADLNGRDTAGLTPLDLAGTSGGGGLLLSWLHAAGYQEPDLH